MRPLSRRSLRAREMKRVEVLFTPEQYARVRAAAESLELKPAQAVRVLALDGVDLILETTEKPDGK